MKTTANANQLTKVQTRKMLDRALVAKWHPFVCECVALMTAKAPRQGYAIRAAGDKWELLYNGAPMFSPCDASTAYGWMQRLPLVVLQREADDLRTTAHMLAGNI